MKFNYAIFQKLRDGGMCWVAAVERLKETERRLTELRLSSTGEYYAYDLRTLEKVAPERLARKPDRANRS